MNDEDFEQLCESIRQAGEIRKGKRKPSRTFKVGDPDPKAIRELIDQRRRLGTGAWSCSFDDLPART